MMLEDIGLPHKRNEEAQNLSGAQGLVLKVSCAFCSALFSYSSVRPNPAVAVDRPIHCKRIAQAMRVIEPVLKAPATNVSEVFGYFYAG